MIKMLFSDLDGTLLCWDNILSKGVSPENRKAIDKLQNHNIQFAIATGRSVGFLPHVFDSTLNFDTVGMCGAVVKLHDEIIYNSDFDGDEIESLLDVFEDKRYDNRFLMATLDNDFVFADPQGKHAREFIMNEDGHIQDYRKVLSKSIKDYIKDPYHCHACCCFCWFDSPEGLFYYQDMLRRKFADRYQIVKSSPHSIVIMKDFANKGTGIAKIASALGINLNEIAVVGDSENDFEMFAMIPASFCMDHSRKDIQGKAKYIVHSVAECIEQIITMNKLEELRNAE